MNSGIFILLGATGDLARRKLIPALYRMLATQKIDKVILLGAAYEKSSIESILKGARTFINVIDEQIWNTLCTHSTYQQLDFNKSDDFTQLHATIKALEQKYNTHNRLVYCAAASHFFCTITQNLVNSGIVQKHTKKTGPWHRIVYEKPFGHDKESAHAINTCIAQNLNEHQVFRIDHYLTKDVVSNIALIRFTNCIFEPLWNNRFIDHIQIILSETIGIENRGSYYDHYGALRDVIQNHALQLLTLIGMESPEKLTGEYIREQRAQILKDVTFVDGVLGQYEGYTHEKDVNPNSKTETFAALKLQVRNKRWNGVPFYIKAGKHLAQKETVIHIKFKTVDCLLTKQCPPDANWLTIQVDPKGNFALTLNVKNPEKPDTLLPVEMEYCHSCRFGMSSSQAYEVLFAEVIRGEQSVSVRFDEIETAWQLIDTITQKKLPLYTYKKNSNGPKQLDIFSYNHGMRWRS